MALEPTRTRILFAIALLVLLAGLVANWAVGRGGVDFPSMYVTGRGALTGANIYQASATEHFQELYGVERPIAMFYPPATSFMMLPFAILPYPLAKLAWLLTIDIVLITGLRALVRYAAPEAGSHVWMFTVGVVLLSSALRWGMMLLQAAPLLLGMLCWFVVVLQREQRGWATALAILAVAIKMTLSLPFLGLLLLRRRYLAACAAVSTWAALNAVGFLRMGTTAFNDYRQSVATLEAFGNINTPDPWNALSLPRLDWTYLFYGLSGNLTLAKLATLGLSGVVSLWLLKEGFFSRQPPTLQETTLFLAPLVCLGSLCVYHHQYDACMVFCPAVLALLVFGKRPRPAWAGLVTLPLLTMILILPIGLAQRFASALLGPVGVGLLKLSFPIAFTAALIGSIAMLRAGTTRRMRSQQV